MGSGKEHITKQLRSGQRIARRRLMSCRDGGVGDLVVSAEGESSHFVAHVEAPTPEHNHEAQTSERTLTLAVTLYRR